ncbi:hypothetical protein EOPP23_04285 [Endozoicomonas sp. OPT23]|uniref:hypothetical protein n=1 Tax=Endozoicomonas sp. OPT23 TaxID=2072845 RepID=UPI00129A8F80|nr:hypothetical protein [Endozoicomonas sp. OPT23]MRI32214.1 hypothetical protein [Endozoicomonas sp. OPT23]
MMLQLTRTASRGLPLILMIMAITLFSQPPALASEGSIAIVLELDPEQQQELFESLHLEKPLNLNRRLHLTIGFIEDISTDNGRNLEPIIRDIISSYMSGNMIHFQANRIEYPFPSDVLAFRPDYESEAVIKKLNQHLYNELYHQSGYKLDVLTRPEHGSYTPHITICRKYFSLDVLTPLKDRLSFLIDQDRSGNMAKQRTNLQFSSEDLSFIYLPKTKTN